jgi:hypothetical protein
MTAMRWHDWGPVREHLRTWGASLLRGRRYTVTVDPRSTRSGVCNFTRRAIQVNPEAFGITDAEQFGCTKAALAHEAGHAWYTEERALRGEDTESEERRGRTILDRLVNILEDERIERCMMGQFVMCRRLFDLLGDVAYRDSDPLPPNDDPMAVIGACLLWRWAHDRRDLGRPKIEDTLSEANLALWGQVRPLVEQSWLAASTHQVVAIARRILAILDIPEDDPDVPDWLKELLDLLGQLLGQRGPGDEAEHGIPLPLPVPGEGRENSPDSGQAGDELRGLLDFLSKQGGKGGGETSIQPTPYLELEARCRPWADQLVAALQVPQPEVETTFAQRGRVQIRAAMRDPANPMREPVDPGPEVPKAAFEILQDRSSSMSEIIRYSREGLMTVHLTLSELRIPHAITAFEGCVVIREYGDTTPIPRALIAGTLPITGTYVGPTLVERGQVLLARPEPIKVLMIVHDGFPFDPEVIQGWIARHPQVFTVGVYLGDEAEDIGAMTGLFGRHRLIACLPFEFPTRLAQFVAGITPRRR